MVYNNKNMIENHFEKGISYYNSENYQDAINEFTFCLKNNPNNAQAYKKRGSSYQQLQQYDLALQDLNKAIKLDAKDIELYANRGFLYATMKKYDLAIKDFNKIVEDDDKDSLAFYIRGNAYKQMGKFKQAIGDFKRGIQLDKDDPQLYISLGLTYACLGQCREAIDSYSKGIQIDSQNSEAWGFRGVAYDTLGQYKEALQNYNKAIELNPKNSRAYNNRGTIYGNLQEYQQAISDYSTAISLDNKLADAYYNRGDMYFDQDKYYEALVDYESALGIEPFDPLYLLKMAQLYKKLRDENKSKDFFQKAIESFNSQSEAQLIAKYNMQIGNIEYIKQTIKEYENMMKEVERIEKEAKKLNHDKIASEAPDLKIRIEVWATDTVLNTEKSKNKKEKNQKKLKQENHLLRKRLDELSKMMKKIKKDQQALKRDQASFKKKQGAINKNFNQRLAALEDQIKKLSKQIHVTEQIMDRIGQLDEDRCEYYYLLYQTIINQFLAYRVASTGFFTEESRQFSNADTIIGTISKFQTVASNIPVLGDLLSIPFEIMNYYQGQKTSVLNSAIAGKITSSRFKTDSEINRAIAYVIDQLIDNEPFNKQLAYAVKEKQQSYIQKIYSTINAAQSFVYSKVFGTQEEIYSYVEQVVALHMTLITKTLVDIKADAFAETTKQNKLFYQLILSAISPESACIISRVEAPQTESRMIGERELDITQETIPGKEIDLRNDKVNEQRKVNSKKQDKESQGWSCAQCWQFFCQCCCC